MDTTIYFSLAFIYALFLILGIKIALKQRWSVSSHLLFIVMAALLYDNLILALGRFIGQGELLESLNRPRYWMHALFTPLLIPFTWQTLRTAGIGWARSTVTAYAVFILTGAIILFEVISLFNLSLRPIWQYGVLSYTRAGGGGGAVMIVIVMFVIFLASMILLINRKYKWLLAGIDCYGTCRCAVHPI